MHIVQPGMEIDVLKENNKIAHENYRLRRTTRSPTRTTAS